MGLAHPQKQWALALGPGWKFRLCVCREKGGRGAWEGSSDSGCGQWLLLASWEDSAGSWSF